MKFPVRSSFSFSRRGQPVADEPVELSGELLPGSGERTAPGDVAGQAGVEGGQPGAEDAAVRLGEQYGDGAVTWLRVATSGAGIASAASASHRRWLACSPAERKAFQFSWFSRRPAPKSRLSQTTSSVRSARCSLKYCLIRLDL